MRELIVSLFPLYYERYIEVFGGGGWVLFHKPPGNDFEVYNDFNSLLVNLYRCVRDQYEELQKELKYVLNSREEFERVRSILDTEQVEEDVKRAAYFYQLIRYSYASGLTSFGSQVAFMASEPAMSRASMAPWVRVMTWEKERLADFHISLTATASRRGRPWPPWSGGQGRAIQPPSANCR